MVATVVSRCFKLFQHVGGVAPLGTTWLLATFLPFKFTGFPWSQMVSDAEPHLLRSFASSDSSDFTVCYWKWPIYSWFTYETWGILQFAMLVCQRVILVRWYHPQLWTPHSFWGPIPVDQWPRCLWRHQGICHCPKRPKNLHRVGSFWALKSTIPASLAENGNT